MNDTLAARLEPRTAATESFDHLYEMVQRVARRLARRLPPHVPVEDLVSAGVVGLLESTARYDAARAPSFGAFAEFRVRGAMLDELRSGDPLTRDMRQRMNEMAAVNRALQAELGREPTDEEAAAALGVSLERYHAMRADLRGHTLCSLDALEQAGLRLEDRTTDPAEEASRAELRARLADAIETLPERDRTVVSLYYFEELSLKQIGERLGVTESRICQILGRATRRLREQLVHLV